MISHRLRPVLTLCLGILVFSTQDLVIKLVAGAYPLSQVICIRCVAAIPVLLPMIARTGGLRGIASPRARGLALRGVVLLVSYTAYYLAFPVMKLADILALFATVPLFIAALARPALGERLSARGWSAVGIGFAGAVVMLHPDADVFEPASLLPILGALSYAVAQLVARRLAARETAPVMAFYQNIVFLLAAALFAAGVAATGPDPGGGRALAFLLRGWTLPSMPDLALMALCGPVAALGMTLLSQAYRIAQGANQVAAFEYTGLIWATLYGYVFWGEVPGIASYVGAALIVGGGVVLLTGKPPAMPAAQLRRAAVGG